MTRPATGRLNIVVNGAPEGGRGWCELDDGKVLAVEVGEADDAAASLACSYDDAMAIKDGELDPSVAFMQGRLKVTGDMGVVMAVLPASASAGGPLQDALGRLLA